VLKQGYLFYMETPEPPRRAPISAARRRGARLRRLAAGDVRGPSTILTGPDEEVSPALQSAKIH